MLKTSTHKNSDCAVGSLGCRDKTGLGFGALLSRNLNVQRLGGESFCMEISQDKMEMRGLEISSANQCLSNIRVFLISAYSIDETIKLN